MSKYGTKSNESFSKSKYFTTSNNGNNTVIRKNLTESSVSNTAKYTNNMYAKPVTQESFSKIQNASEPLSSNTRATKYNIVEKSIIQKRENLYIQKYQSLFKPCLLLHREPALADKRIRQSIRMDLLRPATAPVITIRAAILIRILILI